MPAAIIGQGAFARSVFHARRPGGWPTTPERGPPGEIPDPLPIGLALVFLQNSSGGRWPTQCSPTRLLSKPGERTMRKNSLTEARVRMLKLRKTARDVRDGKLRGFGVRVLPSGKKRFFIHCQYAGERIWKVIGSAGSPSPGSSCLRDAASHELSRQAGDGLLLPLHAPGVSGATGCRERETHRPFPFCTETLQARAATNNSC